MDSASAALGELKVSASSLPSSTSKSPDDATKPKLSMLDIEDHKGVMIRRRVKVAAGNGEASTSSPPPVGVSGVKASVDVAPPPPVPAAVQVGARRGAAGARGRSGVQSNVVPPPPPAQAKAPRASVIAAAAVEEEDEDDEDEDEVIENMGCNSCMHPTCKQSAVQNGLCRCPGADRYGAHCAGTLILDVNSKPNWKLACNQFSCNTLIRFHGDIHNITPQPKIPCPECGVSTVIFEFSKLKTPLPNGQTTHVGCVVCDEFLNSITEVVVGRAVNLLVARQERHRRGANGRGRGRGRGRGGRGGRGARGDVKMSFSEF